MVHRREGEEKLVGMVVGGCRKPWEKEIRGGKKKKKGEEEKRENGRGNHFKECF